jgi:diketogulonate reductase-like aldo/keto reductase
VKSRSLKLICSKIPAIAFGSGSVNKGHDIHHYIEQAIDTGFTHLDTAQCEYARVVLRHMLFC